MKQLLNSLEDLKYYKKEEKIENGNNYCNQYFLKIILNLICWNFQIAKKY